MYEMETKMNASKYTYFTVQYLMTLICMFVYYLIKYENHRLYPYGTLYSSCLLAFLRIPVNRRVVQICLV